MKAQLENNWKLFLDRIKTFKKFGYDIKKEQIFFFEKVNPISGNILEVGTGKGYTTIALAKLGCFFVTVDIDFENQEYAIQNIKHLGLTKNVIFCIEDAQNLSFKDRGFDLIVSVNTIHHLDDPFLVADELIRLIKPGGRIALSDFNQKGLGIIQKLHQIEGKGKHHSCPIGLKEVGEYFSKKGLIVSDYKGDTQDILIAEKKSL